MKVLVLGGAGDMGSRAVEDLAAEQGVERVTIADRNIENARRIAARLDRVDTIQVDANDHAALVDAMGGHDVVASALGPFHLFEAKLVRAAVEAGVDYASICDEWEAAAVVLDRFDEPARKKRVTVVTGLGTSPGMTNVGARYLASRMDRTRRIDVSVFQPLQGGGGPAVVAHMLYIMSGRIAVWRNGRRVMVPALSDAKVVTFPRFGRIKVWRMGHSEPETLPRFIPGIEEVNFFMGFGPGASLLVAPARVGLFTGEKRRKLLQRLVAGVESLSRGKEPAPGAVIIEAWGEKGGKERHELLCGVGRMREATGLALSIGTLMLVRKQLLNTQGGVYAPEGCIEPERFIREMRRKGIVSYRDLAMTRELV